MFTPGFLLVDDEVNGVRVKSADKMVIFMKSITRMVMMLRTLRSRYTKMKPLMLIILMIELRMILKIPLRGGLPPSKNLQVVGRD